MTNENNLNKEYQKALKFLEEKLSKKYDQIESEKENKIKDLNTKMEKLNKEIQKLNNDIEKLRQEKILLEEKLKFLRAYGVNFSDEDDKGENVTEINDFDNFTDYLFGNNSREKIPAENLKKIDEFDEMIDYWQTHLNTEKFGYLKYDKKILASLYFGLQTDQLILLMGNPGTGKTSLVKALAKSFNFADAKIIPVQSNWTDKSDLLGYYNPLEKNYVSTSFLDALIKFSRQAESNPEKLFVICLDEMNLAHIEYYFAEFLSILQDDNAAITLYSEQLRKDILYELENSGFKMDDDKIFYEGTPLESLTLIERKYYFELRRLAQMLINYPAKFKIPKNIKFFGTLNQDETTLDISPKVLDRSYVIRIENFSDEEIEEGEEIPLDYSILQNIEIYPVIPQNYVNPIDFLEKLQYLKSVNISRRVTEGLKTTLDEGYLEWHLGFDKVNDYIVASCVLPKVRIDEEHYNEYAPEIEKLCVGELSKKIWEHINSPKDKQVDFWRR